MIRGDDRAFNHLSLGTVKSFMRSRERNITTEGTEVKFNKKLCELSPFSIERLKKHPTK